MGRIRASKSIAVRVLEGVPKFRTLQVEEVDEFGAGTPFGDDQAR